MSKLLAANDVTGCVNVLNICSELLIDWNALFRIRHSCIFQVEPFHCGFAAWGNEQHLTTYFLRIRRNRNPITIPVDRFCSSPQEADTFAHKYPSDQFTNFLIL